MKKKFLAALFILLIIVLFAVQNAGIVTINILFWNFTISLAVILVICFVCGALVGVLGSIKKKTEDREKKTEVRGQRTEVRGQMTEDREKMKDER